MCYSAKIQADFRHYVREFGATMSIEEFTKLYFQRAEAAKVKIPKALDAAFLSSTDNATADIRQLIEQFKASQTTSLEQELFNQRKRLADAERTLQTKTTKAATESKRIATDKIDATIRRLADIERIELNPRDSRIFPGHYAPVLIVEDDQRLVTPMRYQCRIDGKPATYDSRYPGTYNARRDNLEGFWKPCFGHTHGIMVVDVFYENVSKAKVEGRTLTEGEEDENIVIEFSPEDGQPMLVACLWSRWSAPGQPDLLSFAAITDKPPPEVAVTGHDRCIVPIKPENIDAWLNPEPSDLVSAYAILDDRQRPYYGHRLAA